MHSGIIHLKDRCPLGLDPIEIELAVIGGCERLDVGLILQAVGEEFEENQALRRRHANRSSRPSLNLGTFEHMAVRGQQRLQPIDPHPISPEYCHVMASELLDDLSRIELKTQAFEAREHRWDRYLGDVENKVDVFRLSGPGSIPGCEAADQRI